MRTMKVGELAKEAGINLETMRNYERIGVMPKPKRQDVPGQKRSSLWGPM